jgi:hypothetical protein
VPRDGQGNVLAEGVGTGAHEEDFGMASVEFSF